MWGEVGVAEEDMLDAEAAKQVIRRAARMLGALPAQGHRGQHPAGGLDGHRPGRAVPRPLRHRRGLTAPGDGGALNLAIGLYVARRR